MCVLFGLGCIWVSVDWFYIDYQVLFFCLNEGAFQNCIVNSLFPELCNIPYEELRASGSQIN